MTDTTRNAASVATPASTTRYFISPTSVLDGQATYIGERTVPTLAAGHNNSLAKAVMLPGGLVPGPYFIIAESDTTKVVQEYIETNNTRSRAITIAP